MSLPNLNVTQEAQILEALFKSTGSSFVPSLLLESFTMGVLGACVPLATYMLWYGELTVPHTNSLILFSSVGISLALEDLKNAVFKDPLIASFYILFPYGSYGRAWEYLLPLVTETVLFGFASALFMITAYANFWQSRSQRRSCIALIIPSMASLMYSLSLAHWAISLRCFAVWLEAAAIVGPTSLNTAAFDVVLLALLAFNAVLSDSIVLWRMSVVWNRARPVVVFGAMLLITMFGLNVANIVAQAGFLATPEIPLNIKDSEVIPTYGETSFGLAAVFVSLASNLFATMLVWTKIWLHRRRLSSHLRSDNRRTMVERFMELLVDSGVVYTVIWLLYCISFFRPMMSTTVLGTDSGNDYGTLTVTGYLDAAMAQLTSIYPLIVFILIALDKIHHSRGPRVLRNDNWPKERSPVEAVTVTFQIDIERSTMPIPDSAHPMVENSEDDPGKVAGVAGGEEKHRAMEV
ncbi:hypothetical protein PENSPDRAFT_760203 [Peniophora sp. CONT]|nr:hypothetical protein PENSPDRAFT_760203 [Peniophora sp. CONT]